MSNADLSPEGRKMLFEMLKHISTLDGAGVLLVIAVLEKFPGRAIAPESAAWAIGLFGLSLVMSVAGMFGMAVMEDAEDAKKHHTRTSALLAFLVCVVCFLFGLYVLAISSLKLAGW